MDLVRLYLNEIGQIPLLTHEQEIAYGKQVQQMMLSLTAKESLSEKLGRELTQQEWAQAVTQSPEELAQTLRAGQRAREKMVRANLRLVVAVAKKYMYRGLDLIDLVQEGAIGLQRGIEKFDPSIGYRLSTYSYWWIKQAMSRAIAEQSRTIRMPTHARLDG